MKRFNYIVIAGDGDMSPGHCPPDSSSDNKTATNVKLGQNTAATTDSDPPTSSLSAPIQYSFNMYF